MPLKTAHDIGESLQKKIEDLSEVERVCFRRNFDSNLLLFFLLFRHLCILIMNLIIIHRLNIKVSRNSAFFFLDFIYVF